MTPIVPVNFAGLAQIDVLKAEADRLLAALCAEIDASNGFKAELNQLQGEIRSFSETVSEDTKRWFGDTPDDHLGNIGAYVGWLEAEVERLQGCLLEEHHRALAAEAKAGRLQLDKEYGNK